MKIVGFFGGTFDPIHFGHLGLALHLLELHALDEVLFCPAFCSPFKTETPPIANPQHRLAMLQLALEDFPSPFRITTLELDRGKTCYTVDTLRMLKTNSEQFRLLVSDAELIKTWKEPQELLRLAPPLIGPRLGHLFAGQKAPEAISSTHIRLRLQKGLCCAHLIPAKSLAYILKHQLYG